MPEPQPSTTQPRPSVKRPELPALTGIRAVAAAMVVLSHIGLPSNAPEWMQRVVATGYVGVPLFFVLSGIVLAYNYQNLDPRRGRDVTRFYIARIARVLPIYYAVLLYLAIFRGATRQEQGGLWKHILNIQTWDPNLEIGLGYNPPAWSINVELFFYLLFPLLIPLVMALWRRFGWQGLAGLMALLFVAQWVLCVIFAQQGWADLPAADPLSGHRWLYRHPLPRFVEFCVGMCLALLLDGDWLRRIQARTHTVVQLAMIALTFTLTIIRPWDGPSAGFWRVASFGALYTLPFAVLLLSLASNLGIVARMLSTAPLRSLGISSFAMYMTHRPFLDQIGGSAVRESDSWYGWVLLVLLVGVCMMVGEGAHRYIEDPCRKLLIKLQPAKR